MEQRTRFPGVYRLTDRPGWYRVRGKYRNPRTDERSEVDRVIAAPTASAARTRLVGLVAEAKAGATPQRMRLSAYAASWLERKAGSLQPSTLDRYGRTLRLHVLPALGSLMLDSMRATDVVAFRDRLAKMYDPTTVNSHLRILKAMLADAASELQLHDPAARVQGMSDARAPKEGGAWDGGELGSVLTALLDDDPDAYTCIVLKSASAMRWSEVSAIRWPSLDLDGKTAVVERKRWKRTEGAPKTGSRRIVPLQDEVVAVMRAHYARLVQSGRLTDVVFPGRRSRFRSRTWLAEALDRAIVKAEVPRLTPHGLRHTWNDLLSRVATPEVVRAITGHVTERMRLHYRHVDAGEKAKAQRDALGLVGNLVGKEGRP